MARDVLFTCHSGLLSGEGLPNSLPGIAECLAAGASRIEIDIHSLAGGDYLVCHANRLEEATMSRGAVGSLAREDVAKLRRRDDPEVGLPLLSEVVALMASHDCELQLDLKDWRPLTRERIDALAALVRPLGDRALVSSGQDWNLRAIARVVPALRLGFDPDRYIRARAATKVPAPARLGAYGYRDDHPLALGGAESVAAYLQERIDALVGQCPTAGEFFLEYRLVLQAADDGVLLPELLHERGVSVSAWTLDHDGETSMRILERLAAAGVDRVTTNTMEQFELASRSGQRR
jgi:glycerophosphoryl diester phosphodiesterase